jgi:hypothetical protein
MNDTGYRVNYAQAEKIIVFPLRVGGQPGKNVDSDNSATIDPGFWQHPCRDDGA